MRGLLLVLFLLSGCAGLAYELIWTNTLSLVFGVTSGAITTVLAAFMGGLALGSALLGGWADRTRRPLVLYGVLELLIGVSALLIPFAFNGVNAVYVALARTLPEHTWAFVALRYLLCFAAVLVPTALMGGSLPAITRAWVRKSEQIGTGVGALYGANTLGGVLGVLGTGFLLLRVVGAAATTHLAVSINLLVGFVALWAARGMPAASETAPPASEAERPQSRAMGSPARFLLIAYGLAGATALAYQVLWTRILVYFTGQTMYAFSTILASFLIGIALGSVAIARISDRIRDRVAAFGLMELGIGISAAYLLLAIRYVLPLAYQMRGVIPGGEPAARFAMGFALMLFPTFLMGAVMPIVARAYAGEVGRLGRRLGVLYAANTIGCVLGSLVAGFVLLTWIGAQRGVLVVSVVNVLLGLAILLWSRWRRWLKVGVALPAGALLVGAALLSWSPRPALVYHPDFTAQGLELLYYREGAEASLAVMANSVGRKELNINGSSTAYTEYADVVVHKMLTHVPLLLAEDPKTVLVVGFGLGSTAASACRYPVARVDCVELVPEERETAAFFVSDHKNVFDEPAFRFIAADGRNYLLTTTQQYDVISFNAINPSLSPYLYTQEFYQLCRQRLSPRGVVCAWIPTNMKRFDSLARTFQTVFPHVTLWFCNPFHTVLIATPEPLAIDLDDLTRRMSRPSVRADLREVQLDDPIRLLSTLLLDDAGLRQYTSEAPVNRDDLPHVAFDVAHSDQFGVDNLSRMLSLQARPWDCLTRPLPESDLARWKRYRESAADMIAGYALVMATERWQAAMAAYDRALAISPDDPRLRYLRATATAYACVASPEAFAAPEARREAMDALEAALEPEEMPAERFVTSIRVVLALLHLQAGELDEAQAQARALYRFTPPSFESVMLDYAMAQALARTAEE